MTVGIVINKGNTEVAMPIPHKIGSAHGKWYAVMPYVLTLGSVPLTVLLVVAGLWCAIMGPRYSQSHEKFYF